MKKVILASFIALTVAMISFNNDDDKNPNHPDFDQKIQPEALLDSAREFVVKYF